MYSIRNVSTQDLEPLLELNQANLPHVGTVSLEDLRFFLEQALSFRMVERADSPAGFLLSFDSRAKYQSPNFVWFRKRYPSFAYIDRIVIGERDRRRGLGRLLYDDLRNLAQRDGIPVMACEYNLRPSNTTSALFHKEYGFTEVGQQETEGGKKTVSLQLMHIGF